MGIDGPKIKEIMRERGITQRWLAKQLGISFSTLSQALTKSAMNEVTLKKLADILKIPAVELSLLEKSPDPAIAKGVMETGERLGALLAKIDMSNDAIKSLREEVFNLKRDVGEIKNKFKLFGQ